MLRNSFKSCLRFATNFNFCFKMVTFVCDNCQETLKKTKLDAHFARCRGAVFSCVDCSKTFSGTEYRAHNTCVTEVQKYQKTDFVGTKKPRRPLQSNECIATKAISSIEDNTKLGSKTKITDQNNAIANNQDKSSHSLIIPFILPKELEKKSKDITSFYELVKILKKCGFKEEASKMLKSVSINIKNNSQLELFFK